MGSELASASELAQSICQHAARGYRGVTLILGMGKPPITIIGEYPMAGPAPPVHGEFPDSLDRGFPDTKNQGDAPISMRRAFA